MDADNLLEQQPQAQAAKEAIAEAARARMVMKHYTLVVRQLPMLLQRHGLGQTLAYLQQRGGGTPASPYDLVARQLDRWLLKTMAVSARGALAALSGQDSRFYREASDQAWLFVRALRRGLEAS